MIFITSEEEKVIKKVVNSIEEKIKSFKDLGFPKTDVEMLINGTYIQKQLDVVRGYCEINKTNDTVEKIQLKVERIINNVYDEKPEEVIPMELKMENAHIRIYDKSNTPIPGRIKVSLPENNQVFGKCPVNYEFKMDKNELFCGKAKKKSLDE